MVTVAAEAMLIMAEGWGHLQLGKWLCSASSVSAVVAWTVTEGLLFGPISWCHLETGHLFLTGISKENMHATRALVNHASFHHVIFYLIKDACVAFSITLELGL